MSFLGRLLQDPFVADFNSPLSHAFRLTDTNGGWFCKVFARNMYRVVFSRIPLLLLQRETVTLKSCHHVQGMCFTNKISHNLPPSLSALPLLVACSTLASYQAMTPG